MSVNYQQKVVSLGKCFFVCIFVFCGERRLNFFFLDFGNVLDFFYFLLLLTERRLSNFVITCLFVPFVVVFRSLLVPHSDGCLLFTVTF